MSAKCILLLCTLLLAGTVYAHDVPMEDGGPLKGYLYRVPKECNEAVFVVRFDHLLALEKRKESEMGMTITSPAFLPGQEIPKQYTCDGADISPALAWAGLPVGTKSLALIVDDPDAPDPAAPKMTWVHWVLYNIPPSAPGLPEGVGREGLPEGTKEGLNNWKRTGYGGPCPPIGRHRYFHKLYALDEVLPDLGKPTKGRLEKAMERHILGKAELVGTYQRF